MYCIIMSNLQSRQTKIQEKRKQTPFRDFVMELASRQPLNIYHYDGMLTRYPNTDRKWIIVKDQYASMNNPDIWLYTWDFFADYARFRNDSKRSNLIFFGENENSDYTDACFGAKNCYLSFGLGQNVENALYSSLSSNDCYTIVDSTFVRYSSNTIYSSKVVIRSHSVFYSCTISNSSDLWFCANCISCQHCIGCVDLINQSYCINNQQYSKEDYFEKKKEILSDKISFSAKYRDVLKKMGSINAVDSTGAWLINTNNIHNSYMVVDVYDSRNVVSFHGDETWSNNTYDCLDIGNHFVHAYAVAQRWRSEHIYCSIFGGDSSHCYYSMNLENCSFCFWCLWLINKQFCIFNKQYTKEERYEKIDEIFTQMEKDWQLWEFFPASMNPFYFNDTAAYLIDSSFTKEEVTAKWYLRRDEPIKVDIPEWTPVINARDLDKFEWFDDQWNRAINPEILKQTIVDDEWNAWRVIKMEYDFLMKHWLPLPRKHRLERMKENFRIT